MTTTFVLLDETGGAATSSRREALTPQKLAQAAALLTVYLNRDVAAFWGIPGGALVRAGSSPTDIQPGEWPFHIQPTLPGDPQAIAYHTVNGVGVPDLYDGLTLSATIFGKDGALSAWAHELAETVGDPATNRLCQDLKGKLFALELADADEVAGYPITLPWNGTPASITGYVSNFLLPAFFCPNAAGPYDFMTQERLHPAGERGPNAPFETVPSGGGNYQIVEDDPGNESQVTAIGAAMLHPPPPRVRHEGSLAHRTTKKAHFTSRAYRRGLRIHSPVANTIPAPQG